MSKRLVLCCDGTWNTADQEHDGRACPTNVTKVALAVADRDDHGVEQRVFYQQGLGTAPGERLRGGAFGMGLSRNVKAAYRFLVDNHEPGDEVFVLGFSRGAYTARSTVGLVHNCGILRREHADRLDEAYALYRSRDTRPRDLQSQLFRRTYSHRPPVRFLGVWDTVGSVGIPSLGWGVERLVNRRWGFHDTTLSSTVQSAFQALAIDEQRKPFAPTLWQTRTRTGDQRVADQQVEQVWFSGDHCDIGGGHSNAQLADITLLWMIDRARSCGLAIRDDVLVRPEDGAPRVFDGRVFPVDPDPLGELHDSRRWLYRLLRPHVRPIGDGDRASESLAASALVRHETPGKNYAPRGLTAYLAGDHRVTDVPHAGARQAEHVLSR